MSARSWVVGLVAVAVIVGGACSMMRSCSSHESPVSQEDQYWLLVASEGLVPCPHCGSTVSLTPEQRKAAKAPAKLVCPACGKQFDPLKPAPPPPAPARGARP